MTITREDRTGRMSGIVGFGDLIWLSGQTAEDRNADVREQVMSVLSKIDDKLERSGSDKHHILSATIWLKDISDFDAMNEVWDKWVSDESAPARATVEARLADPRLLVEIGIVAARADSRAGETAWL